MKSVYIFSFVLIVFSCENISTSEDKYLAISRDSNVIVTDSTSASLEQRITSVEGDSIVPYDSLGEYDDYNIYLTIETIHGVQSGHKNISTNYLDKDSLHNSDYLKRALSNDFGNGDSLIYYKNRITYLFGGCFDNVIVEEKEKLYCFIDRTAIPLNEIKKIKIKNIFVNQNLRGIGNTLTLKDTSWINKKPIRCLNFWGYLCSFNLYIYEESKFTTDIIKRANAILLKFKDEEDELDKKLYEEIRKLDGQKVIIIQECTC